jgi:hypothetical protein
MDISLLTGFSFSAGHFCTQFIGELREITSVNARIVYLNVGSVCLLTSMLLLYTLTLKLTRQSYTRCLETCPDY